MAPLGFPMELLRCTRLTALRLPARNSQTLLAFGGLPAGIAALGSLRHLSIVNCLSQQLILALSSLTALTELNVQCNDPPSPSRRYAAANAAGAEGAAGQFEPRAAACGGPERAGGTDAAPVYPPGSEPAALQPTPGPDQAAADGRESRLWIVAAAAAGYVCMADVPVPNMQLVFHTLHVSLINLG